MGRRSGILPAIVGSRHGWITVLPTVLAILGIMIIACDGTQSDNDRVDAGSTNPTPIDRVPATNTARIIPLLPPRTAGSLSLEEAIQSRRSVREFSERALSLPEVGQLLWAAQGVTSPQGARAAPSAGGTYPLELYLAASRVTGLEAGVYRYRPESNDLVLVLPGDVAAALSDAGGEQRWIADAPANVIVAAVYERTTERYGERGERYVHLEAGHAAQNLCLQAVALGLGAVTVGAFSDQGVKDVLRLAEDEQPLYIIPVGRPVS